MPEKKNVQVVKHGDVTQRVGVEVIKARGVDVDLLIKKLIANAAALWSANPNSQAEGNASIPKAERPSGAVFLEQGGVKRSVAPDVRTC